MPTDDYYKTCLKDAGFNCDNMSKEEIMQCYAAIKDSKSTIKGEVEPATTDEQMDSVVETDEQDLITSENMQEEVASTSSIVNEKKSLSQKDSANGEKSPMSDEDLFNSASDNSQKLNCIERMSYQDMPDVSDELLNIIDHKPIYELPILTNPRYCGLTLKKRIALLNHYHARIDGIRTNLARRSIHMAPQPKPILPSAKCKISLLKMIEEDEDTYTFNEEVPEVYISRSGRQVKRKIYNEDLGSDDENPIMTSLKRNKSNGNTKITLDVAFTVETTEKEASPLRSEPKTTQKAAKIKKPASPETPKRLPLAKKTNNVDSPKRYAMLSTKKMSRSEMMFENLLREDKKKEQQDKEMSAFQQTLSGADEEDDIEISIDQTPDQDPLSADQSEKNLVKRRVVPPVPVLRGRKPIGNKKRPVNGTDPDDIDIIPSSPSKQTVKRGETGIKRFYKPLQIETGPVSSSSTSNENSVPCPICDKSFAQNEIEEHAATCGENPEEPPNLPAQVVSSSQEVRTCRLCDETFLYDAEYRVHEKECIGAQIHNM